MTEETIKSYQQKGIRIQLVEVSYNDYKEYKVIRNRRQIWKSELFMSSLGMFRNEVLKNINQLIAF